MTHNFIAMLFIYKITLFCILLNLMPKIKALNQTSIDWNLSLLVKQLEEWYRCCRGRNIVIVSPVIVYIELHLKLVFRLIID